MQPPPPSGTGRKKSRCGEVGGRGIVVVRRCILAGPQQYIGGEVGRQVDRGVVIRRFGEVQFRFRPVRGGGHFVFVAGGEEDQKG